MSASGSGAGRPRINPAAAGLLAFLAVHADLLHPVRGPCGPEAIEWRLAHAHPCLRCGAIAMVAYIAGTERGPRWLDLCRSCDQWLRAGSAAG